MDLRDSDPGIALMDKGYDSDEIRQDLRTARSWCHAGDPHKAQQDRAA